MAKKLFWICLFVLVGVRFVSGQTVVDKYGLIHTDGTKIVDAQGEQVALCGMSLFWSQIRGQFYNYDCVKWLRDDWRCAIVRASMGIEKADNLDGYLVNKEKEYNKVITVIDAAIDLGIYVIVDWHDHNAHHNQDEAVKFFKEIADKYGDKPNIIYEIYNEPMQVSWADDVKPYAEAAITAIREIDPDNLILVGNPTWSQDVDIAADDPLEFNNIAYSLHFYASTHTVDLRKKAEKALELGAPLFVSEFGLSESSGDGPLKMDSVKVWMDFMEEHNLSWCCWSIGDKDETSAALKPGADAKGGWSEDMLTQSGKYMREKIRAVNKELFDSLAGGK